MTGLERTEPTDEELEALEREIEERFPGWVLAGVGRGYGDWLLRAERVGTMPDPQYGVTPKKLLAAIETYEDHRSRSRPIEVQPGPQSG